MADSTVPTIWRLIRLLGVRAWWIAGLAMRRAPRQRPAIAN